MLFRSYLTKQVRQIIGSQAYPIERITAAFGSEYFGCQLDYMGALALDEGFDTWILYGVGQPYVKDRVGKLAQHWYAHHCTFLYWLRLAVARGVEIVLDTPDSNMITLEMIADEQRYPTPPPLATRYGYDMGVEQHSIRDAMREDYATP